MRAYLLGESLCDSGRMEDGIRSFKEASALCWELQCEDWPNWATEMHTEMTLCASQAPTLIAADSAGLHPEFAFLQAQSRCEWWNSPAAVESIAKTLQERHFAVLDGFSGTVHAQHIQGTCTETWNSNTFRPARAPSAQKTRGDWVAWGPEGFDSLTSRVDELVRSLRAVSVPGAAHPEASLERIVCRQRPMVSRYGCGDTFARHVDNARDSKHGNGRMLTAVYYMQDESWSACNDGGCIRIFRPQHVTTDQSNMPGDEPNPSDALFDIAPVGDRLLLFFSDSRVPHEVLRVRRDDAQRFAMTIWYWGPEEVPAWWDGNVHDCTLVPLPSNEKLLL